KNFLKVVAAWIIEDDLPFTTGETPGIKRLFAFLQTHYILPSDTTVRNTLATMYVDIPGRQVEDCCRHRYLDNALDDIHVRSWITSDWELIERVLDFHPIEDKEHEG
ncbi:hypothetical protein B0H13DRAFT_1550389, partial [Mycena leptocephala]